MATPTNTTNFRRRRSVRATAENFLYAAQNPCPSCGGQLLGQVGKGAQGMTPFLGCINFTRTNSPCPTRFFYPPFAWERISRIVLLYVRPRLFAPGKWEVVLSYGRGHQHTLATCGGFKEAFNRKRQLARTFKEGAWESLRKDRRKTTPTRPSA